MSPKIASKNGEQEAILEVAKLMQVAARTAPKTAGIDDIITLVVYGKEKEGIAEKMREIANERNIDGFRRDAKNVDDSDAVLLIGVRGNKSIGINCGACGFKNCKELEDSMKKAGQDFIGSTCVFKALDLGIALGSAVKIADILNVDNRIMYRIGTAALKLNLMPEATVAMGVPLSAKGKNIYFDRKWP
ncbi:hypothetical protein KEJ45_00575 [Candidatus Bathyarchaeota archaeon]|nr:hypothetical protein [Candidatus Bathyarchaeota archaeon]